MRLLLIRHGDPDYVHDDLTPAGRREAELLSDRIAPMEVEQYFVSPLGRAKATAAPTLQKVGRTAVECDWMQEFSIPVARPDLEGLSKVPWDWLPQDWLQDPRLFSPERWRENEILRAAGVGAFVPVQPEPAQVLQRGGGRAGLHLRVVEVFDAEDERASAGADGKPGEQERPGVAEVQRSGRARSQPPDRLFHILARIAALATLERRNLTTVLGGIVIGLPVRGL